MLFALLTPILAQQTVSYPQHLAVQATEEPKKTPVAPETIPDVPFYSQFRDITSSTWQKVGCGVASLAMVIDYYNPDSVSVNTLLKQGVVSGAYQKNAGWSHKGLISLSKKYGLDGGAFDLSALNKKAAFSQFKSYLKDGPVIASVHYKFDPKSTIPHLVVINGVDGDNVYYNDPASTSGQKKISLEQFLKAWKNRFIVVRPVKEKTQVALKSSVSA